MSISLDQLTHILAKIGISSSLLTTTKDVITPPEAHKEESIFEESCISDEEELCEQEIKHDEEGISGDQNQGENHVYKSFID